MARLLQHEGLIGPLTGTPAGGLADLRSAHGAALAGIPFDESFHTADLRAGRGAVGHFGIPKLLVFLWRLTSFPVVGGTPVHVAGCPGQYVFDPTGRQVPLFLPPAPDPDNFADTWTSAREWQVPGPITRSLEQAMASQPTSPPRPPYPFPPPYPDPAAYPGALGYAVHGAEPVRLAGDRPLRASRPPAPTAAHASTTSTASPRHRRRARTTASCSATPRRRWAPRHDRQRRHRPRHRPRRASPPRGTVTIGDSLTYGAARRRRLDHGADPSVLVAAGPQHAAGAAPGAPARRRRRRLGVHRRTARRELVLDGCSVSGCDIVLRGSFDTVRLTACTMDPGTAAPGAPAPPAGSPLGTAVDGAALGPPDLGRGRPGRPRRHQRRDPPAPHRPLRRSGRSAPASAARSRRSTVSDSIVQGIPTTTGPSYGAADVYDPALLASGLLAPDPLSAALFGGAPRRGPGGARRPTWPPAAVPQAVLDGLNALVMRPRPLRPRPLRHRRPQPRRPGAGRGLPAAAAPTGRTSTGACWTRPSRWPWGVAALAVADAHGELDRVTVLGRLARPPPPGERLDPDRLRGRRRHPGRLRALQRLLPRGAGFPGSTSR